MGINIYLYGLSLLSRFQMSPVPTSSSSSSIKAVWTFTDLGCFSWEMKSQSCVKKQFWKLATFFATREHSWGHILSLLTTKRFYSNPQPPHWSGEGSVHRGQQLGPRARKILVTAGWSWTGMIFGVFFFRNGFPSVFWRSRATLLSLTGGYLCTIWSPTIHG